MDLDRLKERLGSDNNVLNNLVRDEHGNVKGVKHKEFTNRPGPKNLSEDEKELIGTLAHLDTSENVARVFKISQPQVSAYKNGLNGSSNATFDGERKERIDNNVKNVKQRVAEIAVSKLTTILDGITPAKVSAAKLGELTLAASNLGKLAHVEEEAKPITNNFVFFTPRQNEESDYEEVHVA